MDGANLGCQVAGEDGTQRLVPALACVLVSVQLLADERQCMDRGRLNDRTGTTACWVTRRGESSKGIPVAL